MAAGSHRPWLHRRSQRRRVGGVYCGSQGAEARNRGSDSEVNKLKMNILIMILLLLSEHLFPH